MAGLTGCAGASDDMSRELAKMQTEVLTLRTQTAALSERLEALETRPAPGQPVAAALPEPASDPRPPLRVVHLGPEQGVAAAEAPYDAGVPADAPEGRVSIRSTPNGLVQEDANGVSTSRAKTMPAEKKSKPAANSSKPAPSKSDAAKKN